MWNFHFQHHIEEDYTLWITAHTHAPEVLVSGLFMGSVIVFLGIQNEAVQIYLAFYSVVNTMQHSNLNYTFGPLNYLIVTPSYHRHHHQKTNRSHYGSTLTIFDYLFQTLSENKINGDTSNFGISDTDKPFGFFKEMTYFLTYFANSKKKNLKAFHHNGSLSAKQKSPL